MQLEVTISVCGEESATPNVEDMKEIRETHMPSWRGSVTKSPPEGATTFVDAIKDVTFDGRHLRIEFGILSAGVNSGRASIAANRPPACRLALTAPQAVELINQIATAMSQ